MVQTSNFIWNIQRWILCPLSELLSQQFQISNVFFNTIVIQNKAEKFVVLTKAKEETEKSFMVIQFSRNSFEQHASKQFSVYSNCYVQIAINSSRFDSIFHIWRSVYTGLVTLFIFPFFGLTHPLDKLLRFGNSAPAKDEHWIIIFGAAASCKQKQSHIANGVKQFLKTVVTF